MALVVCRECGSQVSDKAAVCPKCGAPVGRSKPQKPWYLSKRYGLAMWGALILLWMMRPASKDSEPERDRPQRVVPVERPAPYRIEKFQQGPGQLTLHVEVSPDATIEQMEIWKQEIFKAHKDSRPLMINFYGGVHDAKNLIGTSYQGGQVVSTR